MSRRRLIFAQWIVLKIKLRKATSQYREFNWFRVTKRAQIGGISEKVLRNKVSTRDEELILVYRAKFPLVETLFSDLTVDIINIENEESAKGSNNYK